MVRFRGVMLGSTNPRSASASRCDSQQEVGVSTHVGPFWGRHQPIYGNRQCGIKHVNARHSSANVHPHRERLPPIDSRRPVDTCNGLDGSGTPSPPTNSGVGEPRVKLLLLLRLEMVGLDDRYPLRDPQLPRLRSRLDSAGDVGLKGSPGGGLPPRLPRLAAGGA